MKGTTRTTPRTRAMAGWVALGALLVIGYGRPGTAASGFEGVIKYRLTGQDATFDLVYYLKGAKSRWEVTSLQSKKPPSPDEERMMRGTYMIVDADAGTLTTVMPAQKMYMVMNFREMAKSLPKGETSSETFPKIVKTGKRETVAGYPCEHWLFGEGADRVDMCLAKGLGFFGMTGRVLGRFKATLPSFDRAKLEAQLAAHPELKELVENGAFPLKVEARDLQMVVTQIERKSLSDDLFRPPAGYQAMDWEKMMAPMRKPPR